VILLGSTILLIGTTSVQAAPSSIPQNPAYPPNQASTAQSKPAQTDQHEPASGKTYDINGIVRRAAEFLANGKAERARDIVRATRRACEDGSVHVGQCARWERALKGLDQLLTTARSRESFTNSIGMEMVRIPTGEYMMGSLEQEMDWLRLTFTKIWREGHKQWFQDELPLHPVALTNPIFMSATEVTVGQFRRFVEETRYETDAEKGDGGMVFDEKENRWVPQERMKWDSVPWKIAEDQPVVFVSWNDAKAFCRWLTRKEKRNYRLPTEAEWEMACRGGSVWVRYPWGNRLPGDGDTNFGDGNPKLPEGITTVDDGYRFVSPVGSYPPNGFGLYDMAGNVMEWVEDRYDRNYYESSPLKNPQGPEVGTARVNKGGNWYASPTDARCAFRGFSGPEMSFFNLGFRVVMDEVQDDVAVQVAETGNGTAAAGASSSEGAFPPTEEDGMRLFRQAMFAAQQQQWDEATQFLEEALEVYETRKDYRWIARVKATLAGMYAERERIYKSKELYTQALAEFRKIGDLGSAEIILARLQDLETSPGVSVVEVRKASAADRAGIVPGDLIIEYAGETGFRVQGFKQLVNDYARMDKVTLSVMNGGQIVTLVVPGGPLGVAVEDIKRPPRPRPPREERRGRDDRRRRGRDRDRR
jgi:formylglycine-generating enzyme required for sulfatase activity